MKTDCDRCGKPLVGRAVDFSLGLDEAKVFVKCTCGGIRGLLADIAAHVDDGRLDGPVVDAFSVPIDTSVSFALPALSDDQWCTEMEVRISFRRMVDRISPMFRDVPSSSCLERSMSSVAKVVGGFTNVRVRARDTDGRKVYSLKAQMRKIAFCPGVTFNDSLECSVDEGLLDVAKIAWTSVDICHVKTFVAGAWAYRLRRFECSGTVDFEAEYIGPFMSFEETGRLAVGVLNHLLVSTSMYDGCLERLLPVSLSELSLRCPKVMDVTVLDSDKGFRYKLKADGEPVWVVLYERAWFAISASEPHSLFSFGVIRGGHDVAVPCVMACEMLQSGKLVYLDGIYMHPESVDIVRNYDVNACKFSQAISVTGTVLRQSYSGRQEALEAAKLSDIPSDGLILVHTQSSRCYRIKEPTLDLKVSEGHIFSGGPYKFTWDRPACFGRLATGKVYEFRASGVLSLNEDGTPDMSRIVIDRPRLRPDKLSPNSSLTVMRSLFALSDTRLDDVTVVRAFNEICFSIRSLVYQRAVQNSKLVVDVGTGRLQSRSVMHMDTCSYLLCDPYLDLASLPGGYIDVTGFDSLNIVNCMKSALSSRRPKVLVYVGPLSSLCSPQVLKFMSSFGCCLVCSFSLSYVFSDVCRYIRRYDGIRLHACGFVYDACDGLDDQDEVVVFSTEGVKMTADMRSRTGVYVQPDGTRYVEPILMSSDVPNSEAISGELLEAYPHCRRRLDSIVQNLRVWSIY